jgi:DMSO/TMAO reductase YedYZ molybdopterin-dependent catalytic subunit
MHLTARLAAGLATLLSCVAATAAGPSASLVVSGAVDRPTVYTAAALQALPRLTQTDTFASGSSPQTHTWTGPTLWNVVAATGVQTLPGVKNDILNRYVLATGTDGYRVVYSLGELDPAFGNRADLVATQETLDGKTAPLAGDGFARTTAPGDARGGRYVSNLASLTVRPSASTVAATDGGTSTRFDVSDGVVHASTFDLAALKALPAITETVGGTTWIGVSLWDLLDTTSGVATDPAVKNDILDKYVVATGSDGYKALISMGEIDPAFGHQPDLIAYEANGQLLDSSGFARLIVPGDAKAGRYVSNLINLQVFSAAAPVPEPANAALLLAGLAGLAAFLRGARISRRARPGTLQDLTPCKT